MKLEAMSVLYTHDPERCAGEACTIHNRSEHVMRNYPQFFDPIVRAIFRVCMHRQFHIDPDELDRNVHDYACFNCCGCCRRKR